ncbi:MAG: phosphoglycerate dehydrogenase [Candidatus Odinarchaeota archaeon]
MGNLKVLVLDNFDKAGIEIFNQEGIQTDIKGKLTPDELATIIDNYDGIALRGATKVTAKVFNNISRLKVIGRAGSGTDNIDTKIATKNGVVVMNAPGGNTITTAEHAIALMFALARRVPQACISMKEGKWEKNNFIGTELTDKTLGIIGIGNIGKIVAERALGLKMIVLGYDPFVNKKDMLKLGIEPVNLDEIYARSDFISYHTPLTPETKGMINAQTIAKMKKGVFLINCARGALINEDDLLNALESNHIKGVALDVFPVEPPSSDTGLYNHPNVILTPHLGASTNEAQEKVAVMIAEQICDFLKNGIIRNSINFPSVAAELLPILQPYFYLCERLGSFLGQILEDPLNELRVEYLGNASNLKVASLTLSVLKGILQHQIENVNLVNSRMIAEERGIRITELKSNKADNYMSLISVITITNKGEMSVSGTIFGKIPKIIQINHFPIEAELSGGMLMLENQDVPGVVGKVGTILGEKAINIAGLQLGRKEAGGIAISLINVDNVVPDDVLAQLAKLPHITSAKYLRFSENTFLR